MPPKKTLVNSGDASEIQNTLTAPKKSRSKSLTSTKKEGFRKKKKKDPNLPKRAKSAYLYFTMDRRDEVIKENPHLASKVAEVASILGRRWADLPEEDKSVYIAQAAADKQRYDIEIAAYRNKK